MTDEQGNELWTDDDAAKFLKVKVEDLDTALASGAVVAIVPSTAKRTWDRARLERWARVMAAAVGAGLGPKPRPPGSGGPRP